MRWKLLESSCMLRLCDKILVSFMSKSKITLLLHTTLYASAWAIRGLGVQNPDTVPWNTKLYVHPQHSSMGIHPSPCSKCCTTLLSKGRNSISPCLVCLGFTHLQSKAPGVSWVSALTTCAGLCSQSLSSKPCASVRATSGYHAPWSPDPVDFSQGLPSKQNLYWVCLKIVYLNVSHIPMDYHLIFQWILTMFPIKMAICGYPLFSDKAIGNVSDGHGPVGTSTPSTTSLAIMAACRADSRTSIAFRDLPGWSPGHL